jgi:methyl-accepting chemotaxis protein
MTGMHSNDSLKFPASPTVGFVSIRTALVFSVGVLSLLLMTTLLWKGHGVNEALSAARANRAAAAGENAFIAGVYDLILERVYTDEALRREVPATVASRAEIAKHRDIARRLFENEGLSAIMMLEPVRAKQREITTAIATIDDLRKRADAALAVPKSQRDPQLLERYRPAITDAIQKAVDIWEIALRESTLMDAASKELGFIKQKAWAAHEIAGHERASLTAVLVSRTPMAEDTITANATRRAKVDLLWEQLTIYAALDGSRSKLEGKVRERLIAALARANELYFGKFRSMADGMVKVSNAARAAASASGSGKVEVRYEIGSSEWVETTTPLLYTLIEVMNAAGAAGEVHAALLEAEARWNRNLIGLMLLAGLSGSFVCAYITIFRIARPIDRLTGVLRRLADDDLDVVVPGTNRADELGTMARAVEVLQANTLAKAHLEAEAQSGIAEQRDRIAAERQAEIDFLQELAKLVEAAANGDFSHRIDMASVSGPRASIAEGFNRWADAVSGALGQVVDVVSSLAQGDLTNRMRGADKGELKRLETDVNRMGAEIESIVDRISRASHSVECLTREIGTGVADLSGRTEQQASALEETAASLEELSATVRQNAQNAQAANAAAIAAHDLAETGGGVAGTAIAAMSKIENSSRQIGDIVALIEEIAFQTNILALNAAVEAARAGDAGRGFAVVANEVRALAQRSSQALRDIRTQIADSNTNVSEGVGLVKRADASLREIVGSVKKVADLISEIAAASQEQATGIDQVSRAVGAMDRMTQQNAALVEETNAVLQQAGVQVDELHNAVGFFTVNAAAVQGKSSAPQRVVRHDAMPPPIPGPKAKPSRAVRGVNAAASIDDWREF